MSVGVGRVLRIAQEASARGSVSEVWGSENRMILNRGYNVLFRPQRADDAPRGFGITRFTSASVASRTCRRVLGPFLLPIRQPATNDRSSLFLCGRTPIDSGNTESPTRGGGASVAESWSIRHLPAEWNQRSALFLRKVKFNQTDPYILRTNQIRI